MLKMEDRDRVNHMLISTLQKKLNEFGNVAANHVSGPES